MPVPEHEKEERGPLVGNEQLAAESCAADGRGSHRRAAAAAAAAAGAGVDLARYGGGTFAGERMLQPLSPPGEGVVAASANRPSRVDAVGRADAPFAKLGLVGTVCGASAFREDSRRRQVNSM